MALATSRPRRAALRGSLGWSPAPRRSRALNHNEVHPHKAPGLPFTSRVHRCSLNPVTLSGHSGATSNYPPPHRSVFLLLSQQLTPISSHCRVDSNCGRDVSRAASPEAVLVISSGTLLA